MQIREYARSILDATTLGGKLAAPPADLVDDAPGPAEVVDAPARPESLRIRTAAEARVPGVLGMADPEQKVRILHALANHELMAAELFAAALLRFPDAPAAFRRGLVRILGEEQDHCRLYLERLADFGRRFGDFPVSGYFWSKAAALTTPLKFVAAMALTFESANLDHALAYAEAARAHGDAETAAVLRRVHEDEIGHVRFGVVWLDKLKPAGESLVEAWRRSLDWPLRPERARGEVFHADSRRAAGLPEEWIRLVESAGDPPETPPARD